ncbi:MAG: inositol monophosphatase [candidate division KSB1 bacterium]|nr:inositol monophosphatase [candidate division KSB1 bacterium]MDZ7302781.1 inositol monophosphatase [candidate division KSB1 bacterium]MDZ7310054.1 inositol monophosphatase [candidate division KSB1 bacterium]
MKYQNFLDVAMTAAQAGGEVLLSMAPQHRLLRLESKAEADFVTAADRAAEEKIVSHILAAFPDHQILAEEQTHLGAPEKSAAAAVQWIIDPLDGTTNYIHGVPNFAISIAARQNDEILVGVVLDPVRAELFAAVTGEGATLNGMPIRVSESTQLRDSLLATGFPFRIRHHLPAYVRIFQQFLSAVRDIRRIGSAALDLAYVAAGRFDGFWEFGLSPWDFAAGSLLVREAHGSFSGFEPEENFWKTGNILASNGTLHQPMREIILAAKQMTK